MGTIVDTSKVPFGFVVMAETKEVKARKPRNYVLGGSGVMRFSRSRMYKKHGIKFIKNKATKEKKRGPKAMVVKDIKGDNNGGKRVVRVKRMPRNYPTSEAPRKLKNHKNAFSQHKHKLRPTITPGTILILLCGKHKGKRVVFLKALMMPTSIARNCRSLNTLKEKSLIRKKKSI